MNPAAAAWLLAVLLVERPPLASCPPVAEQAQALRSILSYSWWQFGPAELRDHWPGALRDMGCGSVDGTCHELFGGSSEEHADQDDCLIAFFFGAEAKGQPYGLHSLTVGSDVGSIDAAIPAAQMLWRAVSVPVEACPGAPLPWGPAELARSCAWRDGPAHYRLDLRVEEVEDRFDVHLSLTRSERR